LAGYDYQVVNRQLLPQLVTQSKNLSGHGNRTSGQGAQQHPEEKHAVNRGTEEA